MDRLWTPGEDPHRPDGPSRTRPQRRVPLVRPDFPTVTGELEARVAARERLIPFQKYLWPDFEIRPYQELIAGALELVEQRKITRLMLFAVPQTGKSEEVSRSYPAWYMGRNPDDAQILCSYNADLAYNLSFEARQKVMSPQFRALFGDLSPFDVPVEISAERAATKEWRLQNHRGRMKAAGVGGGIAGFPADQIVIDDPVKDDTVLTPTIRDRIIRWYTGQLQGRLSKKGVIVLAMTRWGEGDLAGYLLREQANGGDLWHVLRITALAEPPRKIREWCERNFIPVERYIVADHVLKTKRGYS